MASTKPTLTPLLPTKPILNKTGALLSPQTTLPSPSPHFQHPASATKAVTSYFAVASPSTMPTTPSILLKPKVLPEAVVSPLEGAATAGLGLSAPGSSDGDEAVVEEQGPRGRLATATSSGASTPHSTIVSPQRPTAAADAAAALQPPTDAGLVDGRTGGPGSGRASRSPSPHCHFAPLPKVELGRPGTRRNSFALGVATRNKIIGAGESPDDPFNMDLELPSTGATTSPSISRRSSRSSSPSPPRRPGSSRSSRTQSPALSRRASTDALNLHFVEAGPPRVSLRSNASSSRDRENGVLGFDASRSKESAQWREDHNAAAGHPMPSIVTTSPDAASTAPRKMAFVEPERVDKDLSRSDGTELDEEEEDEEEDDDDEDGNDDEEEDEEEGEGDKDDEEEDDEDLDEMEQLRVSARAGAIEVVHWHKDEKKEEML